MCAYTVDRAGYYHPGDRVSWLNGPRRERGVIERLYTRRSRFCGTTQMARIRLDDGSRHNVPVVSIWPDDNRMERAAAKSYQSLVWGIVPDEDEQQQIRAEIERDTDEPVVYHGPGGAPF